MIEGKEFYSVKKKHATEFKKYLSDYADTGNYIKNFFSEEERIEAFNLNRVPTPDILGRKSSIHKVTDFKFSSHLHNKIIPKLFPEEDSDNFAIDGMCLLDLFEPTKPHIDGYYPVTENYYIIKICIIPVAFETEQEKVDDIETTFITFEQHYNEYVRGGIEVDQAMERGTLPDTWHDMYGNILPEHNNSFIPEDSPKEDFRHVVYQFDGKMQYGLTIQNKYDMKLGDLATINPYQMHMTKDYALSPIDGKWVFRFSILRKRYE